MGVILFAIIALMEIGLCVWKIKAKASGKTRWMEQLIVRCAQLVAFIAIMLLPNVFFDFKYKGLLIVLIIVTIYTLIRFLISLRKSKETATCKKGLTVLGTVGCILLFLIVSVPAFVFADYNGLETSGEYGVKTAHAILTDENRLEEFETDGSHREVPIYFYYPDVQASGVNADEMQDEFPLIIFSHGAFGYYQSNTSTYMELASNGYVVVSLDHPYHSFFTKDTNGQLITVNSEFMNDVMYVSENNVPEKDIHAISSKWLKLRSDDMNFVLDEIKSFSAPKSNWYVDSDNATLITQAIEMADCSRIGLMGHSLGGATSVMVGRQRDDISAVIDLDGTMLSEQVDFVDEQYVFEDEAYPVPLLAIDSILHHNDMTALGEAYVNQYVINHAADARETYIEDTAHMNFTDLPLFAPALAKMLGTGTIEPRDCINQMNSIILNYYDEYLKN